MQANGKPSPSDGDDRSRRSRPRRGNAHDSGGDTPHSNGIPEGDKSDPKAMVMLLIMTLEMLCDAQGIDPEHAMLLIHQKSPEASPVKVTIAQILSTARYCIE